MLTRYGDFDRTFSIFDELRRRMDHVWQDFDTAATPFPFSSAVWPRVNLFDTGSNLVLYADVPGMTEKDLQLSINDGTLSLRGERKAETHEGYAVHRQERGTLSFSRSIDLPCKVDGEKTSATVKDGVLTITLAKAAEAQPRQIAIRAQ